MQDTCVSGTSMSNMFSAWEEGQADAVRGKAACDRITIKPSRVQHGQFPASREQDLQMHRRGGAAAAIGGEGSRPGSCHASLGPQHLSAPRLACRPRASANSVKSRSMKYGTPMARCMRAILRKRLPRRAGGKQGKGVGSPAGARQRASAGPVRRAVATCTACWPQAGDACMHGHGHACMPAIRPCQAAHCCATANSCRPSHAARSRSVQSQPCPVPPSRLPTPHLKPSAAPRSTPSSCSAMAASSFKRSRCVPSPNHTR